MKDDVQDDWLLTDSGNLCRCHCQVSKELAQMEVLSKLILKSI
jgi:hypothetical protein